MASLQKEDIGTELAGAYRNLLGGPVEPYYLVHENGGYRPYVDVAEAVERVPQADRFVGLTVNIDGEDWAWGTDLSAAGLGRKGTAFDPQPIINQLSNQEGRIQKLEAPITGTTLAGVTAVYATAQAANDALNQAGGGVIRAAVDIQGPLTLSGNVSLYAPGRTVYARQNGAADTLTLTNNTGTVVCRLIERTQAGTGYALVVNSGSPTVRADVLNTQGYNAIFLQYGFLDYDGTATLTNNPGLGAGERIAVLAFSGTLRGRGSIILNSTVFAEALTAYAGAGVDYNGFIQVTDKGRVARNQASALRLRGAAATADQSVYTLNGKTDLYLVLDTRAVPGAAADNAPLVVSVNAAAPPDGYVALHAGCELLAPAGVPSIVNANPGAGRIAVQFAGQGAYNTLPGPGVDLVPLTLAAPAPAPLTPTAGAVTLAFGGPARYALAATGDVSFATTGRGVGGAELTVRVQNTTLAAIALSYESWTTFGAVLPATLAAGKVLILTLACYGTSVSDVDAAAVISN